MSLTNGGVEDPHQQALLVHEVFQTSSLQQGDTWYVLSMRWWDLWKDYTLFDCKADLPSQPHHLSRSCSGTTKGEKPPNIDNSDLIIRPGCPQLQSDLVENRDFILLNKEVWKLLYSWYPGGPILRRRVIGEGQNMRVELYPFCLTVYKVDDFGMPIIDSKLQSPFSRSDTLEEEVLSEMDSVYCKKCKEHRCQTKKLDLWSLPVRLIVHLKRFGRERLDGPLVKIGCSVDFPNELDLEEYMCQKGASSASSTRYELYGVINHHGNVGGGHYTANAVVVPPSAKTLELGEWFNFNDSIVSRAAPEDLDTQAAYVLFYRRID